MIALQRGLPKEIGTHADTSLELIADTPSPFWPRGIGLALRAAALTIGADEVLALDAFESAFDKHLDGIYDRDLLLIVRFVDDRARDRGWTRLAAATGPRRAALEGRQGH